MIIDGSSVPIGETIEADLCIVGAGPAGLSVAAHFLGTNQRVYVLESGNEHPDARSRALSDGDSIGHPYFPLPDASATTGWYRRQSEQTFDNSDRTYGSPSGVADLLDGGIRVSKKTVEASMVRQGLQGRKPKRRRCGRRRRTFS